MGDEEGESVNFKDNKHKKGGVRWDCQHTVQFEHNIALKTHVMHGRLELA